MRIYTLVLLLFLQNTLAQINFSPSRSSQSSEFTSSFSGSASNNVGVQSRLLSSGNQNSCCRPSVECANVMINQRQRAGKTCTQPSGGFGICCSPNFISRASNRVFESADSKVNFDVINTSTRNGVNTRAAVSNAVRSGGQAANDIDNQLSNLRGPTRSTADFYHAKFMKQSRRKTRDQGSAGLFINQVSLRLSQQQSGSSINQKRRRDSSAVNFGVDNSIARQFSNECESNTICASSSKYRLADGSCNNRQEGRLGKSDTVLNRLVLPEYSDGVQAIRKDSNGRDLPSARKVSTQWTSINENNADNRVTTMLMAFGQYIDHDLTHTPVLSNNGRDLDCCSSNSNTNTSSAICAPIDIPFDDRFFTGSRRKSCMNLVRSTPGPALDCSIRYREQVNQITHFLDLSQVYGSTKQEQNQLRSFRDGQLRNGPGPDGPLLPDDNNAEGCKVGSCMKAGDGRVNEVPNLSILHTVFLREHNRIAADISANSGGSDEQIFQETRRFLTAKYQHIIYNEWLPLILGKQYMNRFGLNTLDSGFSNTYNSNVDPRITNEFAAAAFRFGHTMIPGFLKVLGNVGGRLNPDLDLKDTFFKPELLRLPGMYDGLIAGLTRENSQRVDETFSDDITNHLFDGDANGMDLVALNIQRGRDHGIAGYNRYRELCGIGRASSFSGLSRQMSQATIQKLRGIYNNVDDIDLFVGMLSEFTQSDSMLGATALCIIGDQFARLRQGDRYFYDLSGQSGSFSSNELSKIRKSSLARILCDNSNVGDMQPLAFQVPDNTNPLQRCSDGNSIPIP